MLCTVPSPSDQIQEEGAQDISICKRPTSLRV
jgi:hypothetical protein